MATAGVERIEAAQRPGLSASEFRSQWNSQADNERSASRHCGRGRSSCNVPGAACVVRAGRFA
jgi:hypothetical protein